MSAGQKIALQPSLALMLAELRESTTRPLEARNSSPSIDAGIPLPIGDLEYVAEQIG